MAFCYRARLPPSPSACRLSLIISTLYWISSEVSGVCTSVGILGADTLDIMFRSCLTRLTVIPSWSRRPVFQRCLASFAIGALGTLYYYSQHKIHADTIKDACYGKCEIHGKPGESRQNRDGVSLTVLHNSEEASSWGESFYERVRHYVATTRIRGESGISRIDTSVVPKSVFHYRPSSRPNADSVNTLS
jgi:hypothetical protein